MLCVKKAIPGFFVETKRWQRAWIESRYERIAPSSDVPTEYKNPMSFQDPQLSNAEDRDPNGPLDVRTFVADWGNNLGTSQDLIPILERENVKSIPSTLNTMPLLSVALILLSLTYILSLVAFSLLRREHY
jgi:hypothetical protein